MILKEFRLLIAKLPFIAIRLIVVIILIIVILGFEHQMELPWIAIKLEIYH